MLVIGVVSMSVTGTGGAGPAVPGLSRPLRFPNFLTGLTSLSSALSKNCESPLPRTLLQLKPHGPSPQPHAQQPQQHGSGKPHRKVSARIRGGQPSMFTCE